MCVQFPPHTMERSIVKNKIRFPLNCFSEAGGTWSACLYFSQNQKLWHLQWFWPPLLMTVFLLWNVCSVWAGSLSMCALLPHGQIPWKLCICSPPAGHSCRGLLALQWCLVHRWLCSMNWHGGESPMPKVKRSHSLVTAIFEDSLCSQPFTSQSMSVTFPRAQGKRGPLKVYHSYLVLWWNYSSSPWNSARQLTLPPGPWSSCFTAGIKSRANQTVSIWLTYWAVSRVYNMVLYSAEEDHGSPVGN